MRDGQAIEPGLEKLATLSPVTRGLLVSVSTAQGAIGGSTEAVRLALNSFTERGIVRQITAGRYARAWAADELFEVLNESERSFRT